MSACVSVSVAAMLNLRQKEIEINWSEKVYNQQNVNNTTQVIILSNQFVTSSHGNYHDRHQFKFPSL